MCIRDRVEEALALGPFDDVPGHAGLDRAGRIQVLELDPDAVHLDEGRRADGVEHGRAGSRRGHGPGLLSRASWGHPPCGCLETPTCRRPQRAGRSTSIWTGGGEVNSLQTMGQRSVRRASAVLALVVIAPLLVACSSGTSAAPTSSQVTITRDHAGIPHIRAANFTALGYGEAWAFTQDNFCTLAEDFVTVNGERSRYFGPNGQSLNYSAGAYDSNLDSDFFWQSIKASGVATAQLSRPPSAHSPKCWRSTGGTSPATTRTSAQGTSTIRAVRASRGSDRSPSPTCCCGASRSPPRRPAHSSSPTRCST